MASRYPAQGGHSHRRSRLCFEPFGVTETKAPGAARVRRMKSMASLRSTGCPPGRTPGWTP
eukprot:5093716-Pyramimonas_sp.AAC.1